MLTVDNATLAYYQNAAANGWVERQMATVAARTLDGASIVQFGFWTGLSDVTADVLSEEGLVAGQVFYGGGAMEGYGDLAQTSDLTVEHAELKLSALHSQVALMARGHDTRLARVRLYRALLDPASMALVAPPVVEWSGLASRAPLSTPAPGGEAFVTMRVGTLVEDLTRGNPVRRSDARQSLRSGDRIYRYLATVPNWNVRWGGE